MDISGHKATFYRTIKSDQKQKQTELFKAFEIFVNKYKQQEKDKDKDKGHNVNQFQLTL